MLRVGLTGGIGSGKSSVSALLAEHGAVIIDADLNARAVVAKGTPGLAAVLDAFGEQLRTPAGELDREALGRIVFADPDKLARLNGIVHPLIGELTAEQTAAAEKSQAPVVVFDVPLLVENHLEGMYDVVVVVAAQPATQLQRLTDQRGMTEADARARIAAQASLEDRLAVATYVIENDGPREELAPQVDQLWRQLLAVANDTMT